MKLSRTRTDSPGASAPPPGSRDVMSGLIRADMLPPRRDPRAVPGVLEGQQLGIACLARLVAEDDVGVAIRVRRRVEVDQVDCRIGQVATQDVEVVAVVEEVGGEVGHPATPAIGLSITELIYEAVDHVGHQYQHDDRQSDGYDQKG